jgi:septum formation protein
MLNSKIKLILASGSPRRKELLGHLNLPFEIITSNVPEISSETDPVKFALEIARIKGEAVFDELKIKRSQENFMVVSADTIVCLNGKILGKPKDVDEARAYLTELAGRTHSVFTAVSVMLIRDGETDSFSFIDESRVSFETIDDNLMENYLKTGDSLDKAGAYGIQGPSLTFISKVEGSYSNVVGFPLSQFIIETKDFLSHKFPEVPSWLDFFR